MTILTTTQEELDQAQDHAIALGYHWATRVTRLPLSIEDGPIMLHCDLDSKLLTWERHLPFEEALANLTSFEGGEES